MFKMLRTTVKTIHTIHIAFRSQVLETGKARRTSFTFWCVMFSKEPRDQCTCVVPFLLVPTRAVHHREVSGPDLLCHLLRLRCSHTYVFTIRIWPPSYVDRRGVKQPRQLTTFSQLSVCEWSTPQAHRKSFFPYTPAVREWCRAARPFTCL